MLSRRVSTRATGPQRTVRRTAKYHKQRAATIRAAIDVINGRGVKGMTFSEVAARLDLVPTALTYYFADKEELADACFMQAIETYGRLVAEASWGATSAARLGRLVRGYFRLMYDISAGQADALPVFNDVRALDDERVNDAYADLFRAARSLLQPDPPAQLDRSAANARTHHVLSQLGWSAIWLDDCDISDYARAAERMLDILLHGIGAQERAWRPRAIALPRGEARDEVSRETFLRAATSLINEQGYLGASIEKICARLNVSKGSFYHHNETKDDLVVACFERTLETMRAAQRSADWPGASGWERLCAASALLVDYQVCGAAPLLRTSALTCVPEGLQTELITKFDRISARFAATISDGIADRSLRPIDANIAAQMITGMLNAAAELVFWARGLSATEASAVFLQPLFEGMLAPVTPMAVEARERSASLVG